jgi:hypothetical protein
MSSTDTQPTAQAARHRVWQSRNFRLLVVGSTINNLGGPITVVALAFAVLDLGGTATQLGWVPPSPAYLVRMALATRRARGAALRSAAAHPARPI